MLSAWSSAPWTPSVEIGRIEVADCADAGGAWSTYRSPLKSAGLEILAIPAHGMVGLSEARDAGALTVPLPVLTRSWKDAEASELPSR